MMGQQTVTMLRRVLLLAALLLHVRSAPAQPVDEVPVHVLGIVVGADGEAHVECRHHPADPAALDDPAAINAISARLFEPIPEISNLRWRYHDHRVLPERTPRKNGPNQATFSVEYSGFSSAAQSAFQYAVDLWSTRVESSVRIEIRASWNALDENVLGSAGPTYFDDADTEQNWFVPALANAQLGFDRLTERVDVVANFNSDFDHWYFGLDGNPPPGQIDFVTVVLHEIGHGLGFLGSMTVDDGEEEAECNGTAGTGCWGFEDHPGIPVIYDRYAEDDAGNRLIDTSVYPNPSPKLGNRLENGPVVFDGPAATATYGVPPPLFIPQEWEPGSSYSHLDEVTFRDDPSALMTPRVATGEALHDPGPVGCAVFADMGWTTTADCGTLRKPETPAVPVLVSPEDGATDQVPPVTFEWEPAARADAYDVQVALDPDFPSPEVSVVGITETTYTVEDLMRDTTYYWRVRSTSESSVSEYSITYSFSTALAAPPAPVLASPEDGASDVPVDVTLSWLSVPSVTSYEVQVAESEAFAETVLDASVEDTFLVADGLATGGQYFWRVRGVNVSGGGDWSSAYTFATTTLPAAPELVSPAAGAVEVDTSVVLEWTEVPEATSYHVQVGTDSTFAERLVDSTGVAGTTLTVSELQENTVYFWRVRSEADGAVSAWSEVLRFTTLLAVPVVPEPVAPADGAEDVDVPTEFRWTEVSGGDFYELEIAPDSTYSSLVFDRMRADSTRIVVDGLALGTTYYWRVRAVNPAGRSVWTTGSRFTTAADTTGLGSGDDESPPVAAGLGDVYPNPFSDRVTITVELPEAGPVRLSIYDVRGKRVGVLMDQDLGAGTHAIEWTATALASGVYVARLESADGTATRKLLLVRAAR